VGPVESDGRGEEPRMPSRRLLSPLTLRILAVNVLALALLGLGFLYLGEYRRELVENEVAVLQAQARLIALTLGESAVTSIDGPQPHLAPDTTARLVRKLGEPAGPRVRVFDLEGELIVDSRRVLGPGGLIHIQELPPPDDDTLPERWAVRLYDALFDLLPDMSKRERYLESAEQEAAHYPEVVAALRGASESAVRTLGEGTLLLSVSQPVQYYKRVTGALLLSQDSAKIEHAVREVRLNILALFAGALVVTVLLSGYLANAIARPIRHLAAAAERVRRGPGRQAPIPDLSGRRDEIGDLSVSLRAMTDALWARMDAIERFAADVAHEIKNPLTSLRSAVETVARISDPDQQRKLLAIVFDDVRRLDRLISDISDASRLDAELSRSETDRVDLGRMLDALVEIERAAGESAGNGAPPRIVLESAPNADVTVQGIEDRLVQVLRNLLANAVSFSPPGGRIALRAARSGDMVVVTVEDEGQGIPPGKEAAIFERFYTERPAGEAFGTHSGLGLSISRQIVEAHGGTIRAENRLGPDGDVLGARLVVRLPAAA